MHNIARANFPRDRGARRYNEHRLGGYVTTEQAARPASSIPSFSGRARAALQQHQRRVTLLEREFHAADRVLSGALTACDGASQYEMLSAYLEAAQELRVSLQRLESFLLQRLGDPDGAVPVASAAHGLEHEVPAAG